MDPTIEWRKGQHESPLNRGKGDFDATTTAGPYCAVTYNHLVRDCSMQLNKYDQPVSGNDSLLHNRRATIRDDIAKRLRNVCSHLSDTEFKKLVEAMTDQKLKGERSRTV